MSRKPRLLLWSPLPPPAGGIATWTKRLLESELHRRYEVRLVNTNAGVMDHDDRLGRLRLLARTLPEWRRQLREFAPDVVHVNSSAKWPGFVKEALAVGMARRSGAKAVLHIRGRGLQFLWQYPRWQAVYRRMLDWPDRVLVLNRVAAEHARSKGLRRVQQVPNFILPRALPTRDWPPQGRPLRLLFVGWMIPAKGIFELLEAVAAVPDVQLTCVGRWIVEAQGRTSEVAFDEALERLGIADRVHCAGEVSLEEVWDHYEAADVFVLPSWSEGFPNTLLEAMMAGLAAVVSDAGAMPEAVVDGETGLVVAMQSVAELTAAIAHLAEDRALVQSMGRAARTRAMSRYERSQVVNLLADIYDDLLGIDTRPQPVGV